MLVLFSNFDKKCSAGATLLHFYIMICSFTCWILQHALNVGHSNYQIGPNRKYPVPNRGHIVKYLLKTLSERSDLVQISNANLVQTFWACIFSDGDI